MAAKSFGISKSRAQLREATERAVAPLNDRLESAVQQVVGDLMLAPVDELYPDPQNGRWAGDPEPTWEQVQNPDSVAEPDMRKELKRIHELAASMAPPNRQQTPIEVYRGPRGYHIITGNRRYWALRLLNAQEALVILSPEPPLRLRLTQLIENVQRRSLTVRAQLFNLRQVLAEEKEKGTPIEDALDLGRRVGYSEPMAYRWWRILGAPPDVQEAIRGRTITRMMVAFQISNVGNAKRRASLIKNAGLQVGTSDDDDDLDGVNSGAPARPVARPVTKKRAGRVRTSINFFKTKNPAVGKRVVLAVDPNGPYQDVDWESAEVVTELWRNVLGRLERGELP